MTRNGVAAAGAGLEPTDKRAIIRMFGVTRSYGAYKALDDVTLTIAKNDFVFLTGPSGAGKTTLLKLIYLGVSATQGQVLIDGLNLARIDRRRIPILRRRLGIVFQDYKLIATRTVFENVALVLEAAGVKRRLLEQKVKQVLHTVGMAGRSNALPPSLSGGEQQRVAVARAVVGDPLILLADEPTGSLDSASAAVVLDLIRRFHLRGGTVVLATHDQRLIRTIPARVIHLANGRATEAVSG